MPKNRGFLAAICLATFILAVAQQADARIIRKADPEPAKPTTLTAAKTPGCCEPVCCPTPCVTYRHRGPRLCCDCKPGTPLSLLVKNPCTGCEVPVEVCMPACCTGDPQMCCHPGALGRAVIEYEWCCGYKVKVIFKARGDVLVLTWGR